MREQLEALVEERKAKLEAEEHTAELEAEERKAKFEAEKRKAQAEEREQIRLFELEKLSPNLNVKPWVN